MADAGGVDPHQHFTGPAVGKPQRLDFQRLAVGIGRRIFARLVEHGGSDAAH
jgi:hypothetical protein